MVQDLIAMPRKKMPGTRKVVTEAIFSMSSSSTESTKRAQLTHWDFGPVSSILVSTNFSLFMDNLLRIVFFVDDISVFLPIVLYSSYNWEKPSTVATIDLSLADVPFET